MLKRLVNEAHFTLTITTTGPLLIRSGHATITGPDMTPVLTQRNGEWQVYMPGSSLKGVIRSHLEKVSRTLHPNPLVVCDPFLKTKDITKNGSFTPSDYREVSCGDKFEYRSKNKNETINSEIAYRDSCPICRLFGSTEFIGRVSINDAYLVNEGTPRPTEQRDGVGIDRLTGGASHGAKFELEVVAAGTTFATDIYLRNFETWQLGMLLLAVQDMQDGLIRIGSGRSRGLGSIKGAVEAVTISYLGKLNGKTPQEIWGLGKFMSGTEQNAYGTQANDSITLNLDTVEEQRRGLRLQTTFTQDALTKLQDKAIANFVSCLGNWQMPVTMQ